MSSCHGQCLNGATCKVCHFPFKKKRPQCDGSAFGDTIFFLFLVFIRTARAVTTASARQALWALAVKSNGINVTADLVKMEANATLC